MEDEAIFENGVLVEPVAAGVAVGKISKVLVKPESMRVRQIGNTTVKRLSVNGVRNKRIVRNGWKKAVGEGKFIFQILYEFYSKFYIFSVLL